MTNAMKLSFGINPTYQGPNQLETYVRKIKTSKSLGRVISSYNKRYLVLDMKRMMFYYLADRSSAFGSGSEIPLDSINRMYVDTDASTYTKEDQTWLHGMTILTNKKAIRLKFDSRQTLDTWLFAFHNIFSLETRYPIYAYPLPTEPDLPEYQPQPTSTPTKKIEEDRTKETIKDSKDDTLNGKRTDSSAKKASIFSPSDSDKVDFDYDDKAEPKVKAIKRLSNATSSSEEVEANKEEVAKLGKIKTPERKKKDEADKPKSSEIKEEVKQLKEVDPNGEKQQQPNQVESVQTLPIKGLGKLDDLKVSHDVDLDATSTPKSTKTGGMTPGGSALGHVRRTSMSRRNLATGGISMLGEMKKNSQEVSFASKDSKKNSWDEEGSEDLTQSQKAIRRPSNLLQGTKVGGLSRLSLRKDDEGAVKTAVSNIWKDNFAASQPEAKKDEPVKEAKKDNHWDDWDKDMDAEDDTKSKPSSTNSWKQPDNEQTYNNKAKVSEPKPKNDDDWDAEPATYSNNSNKKAVVETKVEDFKPSKQAVHNDWDDDW